MCSKAIHQGLQRPRLSQEEIDDRKNPVSIIISINYLKPHPPSPPKKKSAGPACELKYCLLYQETKDVAVINPSHYSCPSGEGPRSLCIMSQAVKSLGLQRLVQSKLPVCCSRQSQAEASVFEVSPLRLQGWRQPPAAPSKPEVWAGQLITALLQRRNIKKLSGLRTTLCKG